MAVGAGSLKMKATRKIYIINKRFYHRFEILIKKSPNEFVLKAAIKKPKVLGQSPKVLKNHSSQNNPAQKDISGPFRAILGHSVPFQTFWAIPGHSGPFRAIPGHSGPFLAIPGHSGSFRAIPGHPGPFQAILGHSGPFRAILGHSGPSRAIPGHPGPS